MGSRIPALLCDGTALELSWARGRRRRLETVKGATRAQRGIAGSIGDTRGQILINKRLVSAYRTITEVLLLPSHKPRRVSTSLSPRFSLSPSPTSLISSLYRHGIPSACYRLQGFLLPHGRQVILDLSLPPFAQQRRSCSPSQLPKSTC